MRIIPEYEPVGRLYMSFVNEFFHSRFGYGRTIWDIAARVPDEVEIEVFAARDEQQMFSEMAEGSGIEPERVRLNPNSPLRGIVAEYFPVFCLSDDGGGAAIHFRCDKLDLADYLHRFSGDIIDELGVLPLRMEEDFATARLSVNRDLCLLSERDPGSPAAVARLDFFREFFPDQRFVQVPPLAGDVTGDLDMFLWPVRPGVWLLSRYPDGTPQEESVIPSMEAILGHGHEVVRIPGLPGIRHDDVDSMPNYANGILLNDTALFPSYGRREDDLVAGILESLGYSAVPVGCGRIIESNSGLHCISKTLPKVLLPGS